LLRFKRLVIAAFQFDANGKIITTGAALPAGCASMPGTRLAYPPSFTTKLSSNIKPTTNNR